MQKTKQFSLFITGAFLLLFSYSGLAKKAEYFSVDKDGILRAGRHKLRVVHFDSKWKSTLQSSSSISISNRKQDKDKTIINGKYEVKNGTFDFDEQVSINNKQVNYNCSLKSDSAVNTKQLAFVLRLPVDEFNNKSVVFDGKELKLFLPKDKRNILHRGKGEKLVISLDEKVIISGSLNFVIGVRASGKSPFFYIRFNFSSSRGKISASKIQLHLASEKYQFDTFDISQAANMGFQDDFADDKKGGWTDQGPNADLRTLLPGKKKLGAVPFNIIDPSKNAGKSCVVLRGHARPYFPQIASIKITPKQYNWLYMFHTLAWCPREKSAIGTLKAVYSDGTTSNFAITSDQDITDWTRGKAKSNCKIAWIGSAPKFSQVFIYASKFRLDPNKKLKNVELSSNNTAVWGVFALSGLTGQSLPLVPSIEMSTRFRADNNWAAINWKPEVIKANSAIDLSFALDAPAGKYGSVVCRNSYFEFAKKAGNPVRFFGINLSHKAVFMSKKQSEKFATRLARSGYNAVRFQHFDRHLIVPGSPKISKLDNWDKFSYLMHCLRQKGIYYTMDMFSVRRLYKDMEYHDIFATVLLLPIDKDAMRNMQSFTRDLLLKKNVYSGLTLKDDPAYLPFNIINENTLIAELNRFPKIKNRYKKLLEEKLRKEGLNKLSAAEKEQRFGQFVLEMQLKSFHEMKAFLKSIGVNKANSDLNRRWNVALTIPRNSLDYIDNHSYHALYKNKAKEPSQSQRAPSQRWFGFPLEIAPSRIFGKAFASTENQICYANSFRAQYSTLIGAFGGLQGWSESLHYSYAHSVKRLEKAMPAERLNFGSDPMMLFADRIAVMLFTLNNVKSSSLKIPYVVTTRYINKIVDTSGGPKYPEIYYRLGLFAQIGTILADKDSPSLKESLFLVVPKDMIIPEHLKKYNIVRDNEDLLLKLKKYKIPANTGLNGNKLVSSTKQLSYNLNRSLSVVTPNAESLILENKTKKLSGKVLQISNNKIPCVSFLGSLDNKPLEKSKRMLFMYLTDLKNTDTLIVNGKVIMSEGKLPLLVKKGKVTVTLKLTGDKFPEIWALKYDGSRKKKLKVDKTKNGFRFVAQAVTAKDSYFAFEISR